MNIRDKFEEWVRKEHPGFFDSEEEFRRREDGRYLSLGLEKEWKIWQAALEIEVTEEMMAEGMMAFQENWDKWNNEDENPDYLAQDFVRDIFQAMLKAYKGEE